jgi:nitroimidazol reductase NimA-like FMN-containing flavoprotein (pyridoxamine 5'-phosphate oxidase superfamily)
VTLLDGIVCSPTATGHSVNYRSVVVMGKAEPVEGEARKLAAMRDFVEYVIRGRWATVRPPSEQELKGTMVLSVPLVEASAKVRTGFAVDNDEEYADGAWTGVIPMKWKAEAPICDPRGNASIAPPPNIQQYSRPQ